MQRFKLVITGRGTFEGLTDPHSLIYHRNWSFPKSFVEDTREWVSFFTACSHSVTALLIFFIYNINNPKGIFSGFPRRYISPSLCVSLNTNS